MQFTHIILLIISIIVIIYIIKKLKKYKSVYLSDGADGVLYYFLNKNFKNTGFNNFIDKKKYILGKKISIYAKEKILFGPYAGTKFSNLHGWSKVDSSAKYLGTYESQVQQKLIFLSQKFKLKNIVDLGAAEGYHIVSLINKKYFVKGFAFEISKKSKSILYRNIVLNKLEKKIKIFSEANFESLKQNLHVEKLNKTCFLVDIEGNEYNLFTNDFCKYFSKCFFLVEDHSFDIKNKKIQNRFIKNIKNNFKVHFLLDQGKNPFSFKKLDNFSDDEKYLMVSEGRPETMRWIILSPK